jgi:serine/threonine protein kinase
VAIKTLKAQGSVTERQREAFTREIDILKTLQHPQISSLLESGTSGGRVFYFVMDYYAGGNLTVLRQNLKTPHPIRASLRVALLALKGLDCAHRRGIVHRDLKPQNILVEKIEGGSPNVRVADFGLAKSFVKAGLSGMTVTGNFGGTLLYMPPEQFFDFKYVKPISDVWSMAATLYHVITGYPPRQVLEGQDPIRAVLEAPTMHIRERVPSIPATVAEVIDCALSSSLSERYPSATEFRQALKLACRDL